jgi:hypothetical protein
MSSVSGTEGGAPLPPAADDAHDSAFLHQHPFDNVERAIHDSSIVDLRHASDTSDAGTINAAAVAALAAAAAAAAAEAAGNGHKRSRARAGEEEEEVVGAVAGRTLYHRESEWGPGAVGTVGVVRAGGGVGGGLKVVVLEGVGSGPRKAGGVAVLSAV